MMTLKKRKHRIRPAALFIILISVACAFTPVTSAEDACSKLRKTCSAGHYGECIQQGEAVLLLHEKPLLKTSEYATLADIYEILADAAERSANNLEAVRYLSTLLQKLENNLPSSRIAEIKLKIASFYKRAGCYTDALKAYNEIEIQYAAVFPERYAKYAKDASKKITNAQVASITGKAIVSDEADHSAITVKAFNGFEESYTETDPSGHFMLPIYASTAGTRLCFFVYKTGCEPFVLVYSFDGSPEIELDEITLQPLDASASDACMLMGVIYTAVRGGKVRRFHGISNIKQQKIELFKIAKEESEKNKKEMISIATDENGIYKYWLEPGSYLFKTCGFEKKINLKNRRYNIQNALCNTRYMD